VYCIRRQVEGDIGHERIDPQVPEGRRWRHRARVRLLAAVIAGILIAVGNTRSRFFETLFKNLSDLPPRRRVDDLSGDRAAARPRGGAHGTS
jgi:hypothetical protein